MKGRRTQGTEYFSQVSQTGFFESTGRPWEMPWNVHYEDGYRDCWQDVFGYFDGAEQKFYYLVRDYYLMEYRMRELSHTETRCLLRVPSEGRVHLMTVNEQGIFLEEEDYYDDSKSILWLTYDGRVNRRIQLKGRIKQTYICGNLLFYRRNVYMREGVGNRSGDDRLYSAYCMDMHTEKETCIFKATLERCRKEAALVCHWDDKATSSMAENYKYMSAAWLMGNEQGAVLQLEGGGFDYTDHDHIVETDGIEEWYYCDFSTRKICPLSPSLHRSFQFAAAYQNPQKAQAEAMGTGSLPRRPASWPPRKEILAFNMEENVMWVISGRMDGQMRLTPMSLGAEQRIRKDLPEWRITDDILDIFKKRHYFDGERFYYVADNYQKICSLSLDGQVKEWPFRVLPQHGDCCIYRVGEYVFISGMTDEDSGYENRYVCPATDSFHKILFDWAYGADWACAHEQEEEDKRLIEAYEMEQQNKKEQASAVPLNEHSNEKKEIPAAASSLEYWAGFRDYAIEKGVNAKWKLSAATNYNWYAIRLGSAVFRIECSFNTRKETIRAAFFVQNAPDVFARMKQARLPIDGGLAGLGEIVWDGESQAANVSVIASRRVKDTLEQYEWFFQAAEKLYEVCSNALNL